MPLLSESTTWIAVAVAAGAAALAVALFAALVLVLSRGRRSPKQLTKEASGQSSAGFEAMVADLADALERARQETQR